MLNVNEIRVWILKHGIAIIKVEKSKKAKNSNLLFFFNYDNAEKSFRMHIMINYLYRFTLKLNKKFLFNFNITLDINFIKLIGAIKSRMNIASISFVFLHLS